MSKVFITSDTFFGREQIIKKAKRPFETVEEMNEKLVNGKSCFSKTSFTSISASFSRFISFTESQNNFLEIILFPP
jgi:hypothetical protein